MQPSVCSIGAPYDRRTTWHDAQAVELATLVWIHWFSRRRLLGPIDYIPPTEAEARYYAAIRESATMA